MPDDPGRDTAVPEGAPHDPDAHRLGRRYVTLLVAGVSVVALTCVAFLLPAPYVTMRPGPAFDTFGEIGGRQMFTFGKGVKTYPVDGALDFTTVSVTRADTHVSLGSVVEAFLTSDVAVVPRDIVYPDDESAAASKAEGQAQLTSSKDSSLVVALRAAGYRVGERASVAAVAQDGAAAGKLQPKDEITAVDGRRTSSAASVVEAVGRVKPGATVTLDVVRGGTQRTVDVTTRPDPRDASVPRVGVSLGTVYDFPIDVENNVGDEVGGPSAGTMFALAIYDRLTPGSLTGGRTVAGTGTMSPDGTVGPIGGVRQKIAGAAAAGAKVFLVPDANCAEAAQGSDHGMTLVRVATFDEAVKELTALAKDPDARVRTCS
ncbi:MULTISPECIES: PDZ domain-containing protein [unclassified Aeromicrobium]|uniref:YlbL family protein n=1 Tax=unclassified Aeromicrobium TaxID=2633570 RepID=UPI000AA618C2|nr:MULTISPECIES: PDZ domain-containing protein [unclassified Aeromicrobium]